MSSTYKLNVLFYTGKWFLAYSLIIFLLGLAAILTLLTTIMACIGGPKKN